MNDLKMISLFISTDKNLVACQTARAASLRLEAKKLDVIIDRLNNNIFNANLRLNAALFDHMLHMTPRAFLKLLAKYGMN